MQSGLLIAVSAAQHVSDATWMHLERARCHMGLMRVICMFRCANGCCSGPSEIFSTMQVSYLPGVSSESYMHPLPKRLSARSQQSPAGPALPSQARGASPRRPSAPARVLQQVQDKELGLQASLAIETGSEHLRRGQACEDVPCWACPLPSLPRAAVFCLFDGHCGRKTAFEASQKLPNLLAQRASECSQALQEGTGLTQQLGEVFLDADASLSTEEGCTATAVLIWQAEDGSSYLQAANVGDSACLYVDLESEHWQQVTADHRLTNPTERQRLADMGIQLSKNQNRLYGLNVSRCLGDKFLKEEDLGLSAVAHVSSVQQLGASTLIIVATDGLWDVTTATAVVAAARQAYAGGVGSPEAITSELMQLAKRNSTRDDLTVMSILVRAPHSNSLQPES